MLVYLIKHNVNSDNDLIMHAHLQSLIVPSQILFVRPHIFVDILSILH